MIDPSQLRCWQLQRCQVFICVSRLGETAGGVREGTATHRMGQPRACSGIQWQPCSCSFASWESCAGRIAEKPWHVERCQFCRVWTSPSAADSFLPGDARVTRDCWRIPPGTWYMSQRTASVETQTCRVVALLRDQPSLVCGWSRCEGVEVQMRSGIHLQ